MKKIIKNLTAAAMLLCLMLCLCACSDNWEAPYASLQDNGHSVSVRFDANGGMFAGTSDVSVVDVFSTANGIKNSDGTVSFYLLNPEDQQRAQGAYSISRNGYFLAGWYTERTLRVDESGNALDEFGVPTSQSGREQGYTYSGLWTFDSDKLTVDANGSYSSDTPVLTLYAAWVPYINYEFYAVDSESGAAELIDTVQSIDMVIPQWSEKTGKLDLNDFPSRDGYTFDGAYLTEDLSQPMTDNITGKDSYVDYTTGTTSVESVAIYTTWLEGSWFRIYTAEQFYNNTRLDGNYLLYADLDFEGAIWSPTLVKGKFSGSIYGNGHTISNLTVTQADNSQVYGGLFGTLEAGAVIEDVTFENVNFTIAAGSRMQGSTFGLLAGSISSDAALTNVNVTGTLYISENCYPQSDYTIGLLCGSGSTDGVDYTIDCKTAEDNTEKISITVEGDEVTVTFLNP